MIKNRIFTKRKRWFNGIHLVFPHTCGGWSSERIVEGEYDECFPTHVGVIPYHAQGTSLPKHFPYASGGDPLSAFSDKEHQCFPHTSGGVFVSSAVSVLDFFSYQRSSVILFCISMFPYFTILSVSNLDFLKLNSMTFRWLLPTRFLSFIFTFGVFLYYFCDPKKCFSVSFSVIFCAHQLMFFIIKKCLDPWLKC